LPMSNGHGHTFLFAMREGAVGAGGTEERWANQRPFI
jgi:hypothetical protein